MALREKRISPRRDENEWIDEVDIDQLLFRFPAGEAHVAGEDPGVELHVPSHYPQSSLS